MATKYETASALLVAADHNKPAVIEQINTYILTSLGHDAAGADKSAKYTSLAPTYNVPYYAAALIVLGITTPSDLERVSELALVES